VKRVIHLALLGLIFLLGPSSPALAHSTERAFILILPTQHYIVGGALVVALSFFVVGLIPALGFDALERVRWRIFRVPAWVGTVPSIIAAAFVLALIVAGYIGDRNPLYNPLPQVLWGLWWVGFVFVHVLFGNLWSVLNPWKGLYFLLTSLPGLRGWRSSPPLKYPASAGYWPSIVLFVAFAWYELIHPAPMDPAELASASIVYLGVTLMGMLLFGSDAWLSRGDAFSIFFRIVSWLAPFSHGRPGTAKGDDKDSSLWLVLPGIKLLGVGTLPVTGAGFVLLALATVSFDGLSRTFWWLGLIGENPLEHPGRTALMGINTVGLAATYATIWMVFGGAIVLGCILVKRPDRIRHDVMRVVVSIVPIAFAYHMAHYLPSFLIQSQDAVRALSDPYDLGWDVLGTRDLHVGTSLLNNYHSVRAIWLVQVVAIVVGHVVAVAVAHVLALRDAANRQEAFLYQIPMILMMIGYTLFGLWLLSTPSAG